MHRETLKLTWRTQTKYSSCLLSMISFTRVISFMKLTKIQPTQRGREIDVWLNLWYVHQDEDEGKLFADEVLEYHEPDNGEW